MSDQAGTAAPLVAARPRPTIAWRGLAWLLRLALFLVLLAVLGAAALAWRLAQGPLEVGWLARRIEASALPPDGPAHLAIANATVAWNGFQNGADGALVFRFDQVRLLDATGAADASLGHLELSISALRLLEGRVVPRSLAATALRLGADRAQDGTLRLHLPDLGEPTDASDAADQDAPTLPAILSELRRPAGGDQSQAPPSLRALAQLQHIELHDAAIALRDLATGRTLDATVDSLDLERQPQGGVKGSATGKLALAGATATLRLATDLLPGGGTHLALSIDPTQTNALAQADPSLAALGALDATMGARVTLDLAPDLLPRRGELHIAADTGLLALPGVDIHFDRLALDADAAWPGNTWRPTTLAIHRALAVVSSARGAWSTTVSASADVARHDGKVEAKLDLALDHLAVADLPALWPTGIGIHVRPWLTENLTAGTLRNGAAKLTLVAPETNLAALDIAQATGSLDGEDLTIFWLRPVPPIEHAAAHLTFDNPDEVDIAMPSGVQGAIALKDATLRFTSLQSKDQDMTLVTGVSGPVPDVLTLLKHPRLHLLDKHPLQIKSAAGTLASRLTLSMPMKHDVRADQLKIAVQGTLSDLKLGGLVAGRDLDHGDLDIDVTQDGMKATGTAQLGTIPSTVSDEMDFRPGGPDQVLQRCTATARATPAQLQAAGIDPGGVMQAGQVGLVATYTLQRSGAARIELQADLTRTALALLGWAKPIGPAAEGHAIVDLQDDKLAAISAIDLHGPMLTVVGRADLVGGRPLLLRFSVIELGATRAAGEVRLPAGPGQPLRASLRGTMLDLSTELSAKPSAPAGTSRGAWTADVHFDRVTLVHGRTFENVTGRAEDDGNRLTLLDVASGGREKLRAIVAPQGTGRRISIRADDAGEILQALDVTTSVSGGKLSLEGSFDDRTPASPLTATLDITDFQVNDAVVLGKLLQAVTVYGLFDAMRGQGVQFNRLYLPFRYDRRQIHVGDARAFSASLGVTARGWIDLARKQMDLRGTIVPAYAVNAALGRIPLIGRLFSPERGSGLVAVNYSVTGNAADPSVMVNPLSALTPGFLRGLFNIFG